MKYIRIKIQVIALLILSSEFFACEAPEGNSKKKIESVIEDNTIGVSLLITDTVDTSESIIYYLQNKKEIPLNFIVNKTVIDSIYYMDSFYSNEGEGPYFEGDTVYNWNDNYNIGIINYHGLVCSYKFILAIDSKNLVNTSYLIGSRDCDRDGDREYYYFSFIIEKKKIVVSENMVAKGQDIEDSKIIETIEYLIDDSGKLIEKE